MERQKRHTLDLDTLESLGLDFEHLLVASSGKRITVRVDPLVEKMDFRVYHNNDRVLIAQSFLDAAKHYNSI